VPAQVSAEYVPPTLAYRPWVLIGDERTGRSDTNVAPVTTRTTRTPKDASEALSFGIGTSDGALTLVLVIASAAGLDAHPAATVSSDELHADCRCSSRTCQQRH
jgi:hypothetical protein